MKANSIRDIWTVMKFTMRDMVSRKSFRISTIIILLLIILGCNLPNLISSFGGDLNFTSTILLVDRDNLFQGALEQYDNVEGGIFTTKVSQADDSTITEQINAGEIFAALVITAAEKSNQVNINYLVKNTATASLFPQEILSVLKDLYYYNLLEQEGMSEAEIANLMPVFSVGVNQVESQEVGGNIDAIMMVSCVLFFAIYFCALQVSSSITVEKTSKIMETLVTSTSPSSIILGKTLGVGLVGLGQMSLFAITAIICARSALDPAILGELFDLSSLTPYLAVVMLTYFILGYFAYALLYALAGSTVSKPEDIQAANTPVVIVTLVGFYLTFFTLMDPTSQLNTVAALLPISSPFCMPLRVMMGLASGWDVVLSVAILIAFCCIVAKVAIKIYSDAILNYGSRMTIRDMIKTYKEK